MEDLHKSVCYLGPVGRSAVRYRDWQSAIVYSQIQWRGMGYSVMELLKDICCDLDSNGG